MAKNISPEEKLLSIIKNKGRAKKQEPADSAKEQSKNAAQAFQAKADEKLTNVLKSGMFKNRLFEPETLKTVNKYLFIALGILLSYFVIDLAFIRPYKNAKEIADKPVTETQQIPATQANNAAGVKDYSSYSGAMPSRQIFGQGQNQDTATENVTTSDNITERVGLVGILAGDNPQAIIEDKKAQKTYYLNKGQSFDGYVVEEISENKVTLNYEGKKITLFL